MTCAGKLHTLPLAKLRLDGGTQMRVETDRAYQDELVGLFSEDNPVWPQNLPAGEACFDGQDYWVYDGHHRYYAAQEAGCVNVPVMVREGTQADAQWMACGANKSHGLRRTKGDLENSIRAAWKLSLERNPHRQVASSEIAQHVGCSQRYAAEFNPLRKPKEAVNIPTSGVRLENCSKGGQAREKNNSLPELPKTPAWAYSVEPEEAEEYDEEENRSEEATPAAETDERGGDVPNAPSSGSSAAEWSADATPPEGIPSPSVSAVDEVGLPIPSGPSEDAFAALDFFDAIERELREAARLINQLATMPGAELYRSEHLRVKQRTKDGEPIEVFHSADVENAIKELRHWRPYASVCPHCKDAPKQTCKVCRGLPYLIEYAWNHTPEKLRKAVIDERTKGGGNGPA